MARTARVHSVETVERFRTALCEFAKEAKDALAAADMHIFRTLDWLVDQAKYWQHQIRVRQEEVVRAKNELNSRKNMGKEGRGPGTTDQEKALRKAEARLKEAEEKLRNCRRWQPLLQHAVQEYQGPTRALAGAVDIDLAQAIALLRQKLDALEAYLALAPPVLASASPEADADAIALTNSAEAAPVLAAEPLPEKSANEPEQQRDGVEREPENATHPLGRHQERLE